ncbi:organic solute transporter subunit alpha-like [Antedon mediterranea]|uniref:organic solute transporter subunit alpha-like n=1 Tax=Antedon mediterranea TaxID=105859 RepID=UPI003AF75B42
MADDNCSGGDPTTSEMFKEFANDTGSLLTLITLTLMSFTTMFLYLESSMYINQKIASSRRRVRLLCILGIYPVLSGTSLIALYVPAAHLLCSFTGSIFFSVAMFQFLMLVFDFYGGKMYVIEVLKDQKLPLASPPLTCCCPCLPKMDVNEKNLRWVKRLVLQVAFVRPIALFVASVLWANGSYRPKLAFDEAFLYIQLISFSSTFIAIYGIVMIFRASREPLQDFRITPKFLAIQIALILTNGQTIFLALLVLVDVIPCTPPFKSQTRANYVNDMLIITEMFFFFIMARVYFRTRIGNEESLQQVKNKIMLNAQKHFPDSCPNCGFQNDKTDDVNGITISHINGQQTADEATSPEDKENLLNKQGMFMILNGGETVNV